MHPPAAGEPSDTPRLLVVEDDAATRSVLRLLLQDAGYAVEAAADGRQGLARLQAGGIALALIDLTLPDLDGLELCRRARATVSPLYPPLIAMVPREAPDQPRSSLAAGADDYLVKPFHRAALFDRVGVWLGAGARLLQAHAAVERAQAAAAAARREGVRLAMRELRHLLNNDLVVPIMAVDLLQESRELPPRLRELAEDAARWLAYAEGHIQAFEDVVRVEVHDTPVGPALDLGRSTEPPLG